MERVDGRLIFSATDLINHLECPHLTRLNIEVALGRADLTETRSDTTNLVARKGDEHEQAYLAQLRADGREVVEIKSEPGLEATRAGARETVLCRANRVVSLRDRWARMSPGTSGSIFASTVIWIRMVLSNPSSPPLLTASSSPFPTAWSR